MKLIINIPLYTYCSHLFFIIVPILPYQGRALDFLVSSTDLLSLPWTNPTKCSCVNRAWSCSACETSMMERIRSALSGNINKQNIIVPNVQGSSSACQTSIIERIWWWKSQISRNWILQAIVRSAIGGELLTDCLLKTLEAKGIPVSPFHTLVQCLRHLLDVFLLLLGWEVLCLKKDPHRCDYKDVDTGGSLTLDGNFCQPSC